MSPGIHVYTIGQGPLTLETFIALLTRYWIRVVVDVRLPQEISNHWKPVSLEKPLFQAGIAYVRFEYPLAELPTEVLSKPARIKKSRTSARSRSLPTSASQLPLDLNQAIERLIRTAGRMELALLGHSENPATCHRRRLLGRELNHRGVEVRHIRANGTLEIDPPAHAAQLELFSG